MPNISLVTLAGIPGVDPAAMTQANANSCGAYAVVAAVGAFGGFLREMRFQSVGPQIIDSRGSITPNYHQLSAAVYQVTGVLNNTGNIPAVPELLAAGNAYNSPAAMAQVAINLGRPAPHINVQAAGFVGLGAKYPGERARCEAVVGVGNVNVAAGNYAAPGAGATHIVCVQTGAGGLHWVAQGSDGNFYDPGNGTLNNAWAPVDTGDAMGAYVFSGLWMVIS